MFDNVILMSVFFMRTYIYETDGTSDDIVLDTTYYIKLAHENAKRHHEEIKKEFPLELK